MCGDGGYRGSYDNYGGYSRSYVAPEPSKAEQKKAEEAKKALEKAKAKAMQPCSTPFGWFVLGSRGNSRLRGPRIPSQCQGTADWSEEDKECIHKDKIDGKDFYTCSKCRVHTPLELPHRIYRDTHFSCNCNWEEGTTSDPIVNRITALRRLSTTGDIKVKEIDELNELEKNFYPTQWPPIDAILEGHSALHRYKLPRFEGEDDD
jgi:hypothetical protein